MFEVNTTAELRQINVRAEAHGDDWVRAIDIKLMLLDVPVEKISSAVPKMKDRFYKGDEPILQEIFPFQVQHKIENLKAHIGPKKGGVTLNGVDIKTKAKVWPKPGHVANLEVKIQASDFTDGVLDKLSKWLKDEIKVELMQRQTELEGMEQGEPEKVA